MQIIARPVNVVDNLGRDNQTSVLLGAWKFIYAGSVTSRLFLGNYTRPTERRTNGTTDKPTDQQTDRGGHKGVTPPINF